LFATLLICSSHASAAGKRRHFEPDDLELERPGTLDLDLQVGPVYGDSPSKDHLLLPDFELALGLAPNVELDVHGAFTEDGVARRHVSGDALWVASKLGLWDTRTDSGDTWAVGAVLGPRFPIIDEAGIGYGALALLGYGHRRRLALVLNAGSFIDPGTKLGDRRPLSVLFGLDLNAELDVRGVWSLQSEVGTAYYLSPDPHELFFALGGTYAVSARLDVSLTALGGVLPNTDHAALLLGVSPQFGLW